MRCYGEKVIIKDFQIASLPVKELIGEVDSEEEEWNCVNSKFKCKDHLMDKKARMNIKKMQLSVSVMKFEGGLNYCGKRDKSINSGTSLDECPRWREIETWEHLL